MLLDGFFTEVGTPPPAAIRPTCPTSANTVGRLETLATVSLSDTSDTSDTKTVDEKPQRENKHPAPVPDWTPDTWDGRPCCFLPYTTPARLRGILPPDLRGMGVPSNALPPFLRGFSACGWSLELVAGRLTLNQARPDARNKEGCRKYLDINTAMVMHDWWLYEKLVGRVGHVGRPYGEADLQASDNQKAMSDMSDGIHRGAK